MRIVGGEFRGRRLKAPRGLKTRPTAEKVREALFDILGGRVRECLFLDLYAGTGAVGLEALSRGARRAVLVEGGAKIAAILRENLEALGLGEKARLLIAPAEKALWLLGQEGEEFDVAFCDPPYADPGWPGCLARLDDLVPLRAEGLVILEHAVRRPPDVPRGFEIVKGYRYGDTGLMVLRKVKSEK